MITKEQIRAEAKIYGETLPFRNAFIAGAEWALAQDGWISVEERLPLAFLTGNWDDKKSEPVLVKTKDNKYFIAVTYQGTMDGNEFCDWYDDRDFEIKDVVSWKEI